MTGTGFPVSTFRRWRSKPYLRSWASKTGRALPAGTRSAVRTVRAGEGASLPHRQHLTIDSAIGDWLENPAGRTVLIDVNVSSQAPLRGSPETESAQTAVPGARRGTFGREAGSGQRTIRPEPPVTGRPADSARAVSENLGRTLPGKAAVAHNPTPESRASFSAKARSGTGEISTCASHIVGVSSGNTAAPESKPLPGP